MSDSRWVVRKGPPRPEGRLICFPFGGGAASFYRPWRSLLDPRLELCAVQLPGRESRFGEPPLRDREQLLDLLLEALLPLLDVPSVFFGHSMGAMLAHRLSLRLAGRTTGLKALLVSGHPAPHLPFHVAANDVKTDAEFLELLKGYGGIAPEALGSEELLGLMLPVVRADFALAARPALPPEVKLSLPVVAFGGSDDASAPPATIEAWRAATTGAFSHVLLPGGHFFLKDHAVQLLREAERYL